LFGAEHPAVAESMHNLAGLLWNKRDLAGAEPLYREALEIWRRTLPANHLNIAAVLDGLGCVLLARKVLPEAESLLRESLAIREGQQPPTHQLRCITMSMLGELLARQGKFEEAEPLLIKAYDGLKEQPDKIPKQETVTRLIWLYEQWGRPDDAAKWQAERSQTSSTTP